MGSAWRWSSRVGLGLVALVIAFGATACGPTAKITRVSVANNGSQGSCQSYQGSISADGRYVAFSSCSAFATPDNAVNDVFVRDTQNGTTTLVSISKSGHGTSDNVSGDPRISANGRYVVFSSASDDLVNGDTNNNWDVFVRDLKTSKTTRVSVSSAGVAGNGRSAGGSISNDGRYVVFQSEATNLVSKDTNKKIDVFLRDLVNGTTIRLSVRVGGAQADEDSTEPVITPDGRYVAFASQDGLISSADDAPSFSNAYVLDRTTGVLKLGSCVGVLCPNGAEGVLGELDVSNDGRYTSYSALYVWRYDTHDASASEASIQMDNGHGDYSGDAVISADGRFVAFNSLDGNLVSNDTNGQNDVFVRDFESATTTRVSTTSTGAQIGDGGDATNPSMGATPRFITFDSVNEHIVSGDTNGVGDVFRRDAGA
jgi:Tol biopolymer transport system component